MFQKFIERRCSLNKFDGVSSWTPRAGHPEQQPLEQAPCPENLRFLDFRLDLGVAPSFDPIYHDSSVPETGGLCCPVFKQN